MMIYFLDKEDVLMLHQTLVDTYGGSHGIRDEGLLLSAIDMPQAAMMGGYLHEDIFEMAAAYLFHIGKNHPFVDGNKRTALASADTFLQINGYDLQMEEDVLYDLVLETITGGKGKKALAELFSRNCVRIERE